MNKKDFWLAILFIFASLLIYTIFPYKDTFQSIVVTLVFFAILPFLFTKYILKYDNLLLFKIGNYKEGLIFSSIAFFVTLLIILTFFYFSDFLKDYFIPSYIIDSYGNFLMYEFFIVFPFLIIYEFYFRGFLMKILSEKIGLWSIVAQFLVFSLLVFISGEKTIQYFPYLLFAPFAGYISLRSGSLIYSITAQFLLILLLNVMVIQKIG